MKYTNAVISATAVVLSNLLFGQVIAQTPVEPVPLQKAVAPSLTDGEVRKIDKQAGKITIKHGEIKHLDMPGMTMVFVAQDKSLLDKVQPGDKIRFMATYENGKMTVTDIQPAHAR